MGPVLGPHARTDRTRDTRVAEPRPPAPEDGRPGRGTAPDTRRPSQRWQAAPPGDGPPPPPRHAAPTGHAGQGDSVGPPHPHTRAHSTWVANPNSPPNGRAVGGGTAPDLIRPSQWWKAPPPGDALPPPPQRATPARKGARCGAGAGSPRPHRPHPEHTGRGTPAARSRGRAAGGGTAPDLRRPSQWWKAPPPGTPFRHPHSEQRRPARAHAVGPVLGPHARTDRTRDTRVAEPRLPAPEDGRPGEGQRLTPDAPHNGGRPPPPGTAPHHPRGTQPPQGMQAKGTVLGPHTHTPATTARGWQTPTARPMGGQSGEGQRLTSYAPHNGGRHPPPGDALPPPPQRATPACKGARCGAGAGSPRPHRPHPEHTGRGTPAARSRGRAAKGEGQRLTPDAPHNGGRPPPRGGPPPPPRHAAPTGHAGQGDSVGPPHPHTRAHSTWVADPNSPPSGRAVGGGTAPDLRRPSQWWKAPPPGTPFRHPHSEQRRPARAHAVGPVLGPHARTDRTRDTRVAEPRLPAPKDGRPGEGQRLTPDAPHNGGRAPPPGTAPHHPRGTQHPQGMQAKGTVLGPHTHTPATTACGWRTPTARPVGRQFGEGERPTSNAPHNGGRHPPGNALPPPPQRATPARKGARCGAGAGSRARTDRTRDTRVAEPRLPAPEDGRPGEGRRLTPDAPHNGGRPPPPGTAPHHPRGTQPPQGMQAKGTVLGPHTHTPAPTARGWRTPTARPVGGQSGEGQRLTSDAPHNGGRHPPRGRPSATPTASNAGPQGRTLWGRCWVPTPAPTAPGTHGSRSPGRPPHRTGGRERDSA